jgi:hypothetical protein
MRPSAAAAEGAEQDRDKPRGAEAAPARQARQPQRRPGKAGKSRSALWRSLPIAPPRLIFHRNRRAAEERYDCPMLDDAQQVHAEQRMAAAGPPRPRKDASLSACDGAGDTNAVDRSLAAAGNLNRTIAAALKALFRMVAKVLADKADEPRPGAARRRRGETDGGLLKPIVSQPAVAGRPAARGRYAALQPARTESEASLCADDPYAAATAYLSDTLAWLQQNADNDQWHDDDFSAKQEQYFPQP